MLGAECFVIWREDLILVILPQVLSIPKLASNFEQQRGIGTRENGSSKSCLGAGLCKGAASVKRSSKICPPGRTVEIKPWGWGLGTLR